MDMMHFGTYLHNVYDVFYNIIRKYMGMIPRTLGPSNAFILLNDWICLHGVLD